MTDPILAKAFAYANDSEQATLIDSLARELFVACGGRYANGVSQGYEQQVCCISRKLGADGITLIKDLYAFIELRERDMK